MKMGSSSIVLVAFLGWPAAPALAERRAIVAGLEVEAPGPLQVAQPRHESWGGASATVRTIHGLGFQETESGITFNQGVTTTHRYRTGGGAYLWFDADLADLPAGAQFEGLEVEGCDSNPAESLSVAIFRRGSPAGPTGVIMGVTTGGPATPGCAFFGSATNIPPGSFVDNENNAYFVRAELAATDETTSLGAVRIYYRLRVSPAPATATFTDVPIGHPQLRFVEALAASGVTGGCGGGNYCPDSPLTRGQMAVFLATALGLHFPN